MKKAALLLAVVLIGLAAVVLVRTWRFEAPQPEVPPVRVAVDAEGAAARLAGAVALPTVSYQDAPTDSAAFRAMHGYLARAFPRAHAALTREVVEGLSLLYTWPGTDPSLAPILLLSHMDVVPVEPGTEDDWAHPPFDSTRADGFIWGRGTLDDKVGVVGILEAVETLLARDFAPERTVYLAFGHDEEIGGAGAVAMAALLEARDIRPAFVLDEGGAIVTEALPGLDMPVAVVGVAEKGYLSLELRVEGAGGHSSTPPPNTAVGVLAAAITRLEAEPLPARLDGAAAALFDYAGPEMGFGQKTVFANLWLFEPLVLRLLADAPAPNALTRTTTAATMFTGSPKENVLPSAATAVVNFRILPGDTRESVTEAVRAIIDDERVTLRRLGGDSDPSPVSPTDGVGFPAIQRSILEVTDHPALIVAPYLVVGATDARHYVGLSDEVFRFVPFTLNQADRARIHGTNERIAEADYATTVRFFIRLIEHATGVGESVSL